MMRLFRFGLMLLFAVAARAQDPAAILDRLLPDHAQATPEAAVFTRRITGNGGEAYSVQFELSAGTTEVATPPGIRFLAPPDATAGRVVSGFKFLNPNDGKGGLRQIGYGGD